MAAGGEAVSGNSRGSSAVLESTLDRRFQGVSNTMESIQGLSTWCIENKKYHSLVVRSWLKWMRKSDPSHRLNLFYLANDVIQNCKRRNAIVYRTTFTDVLPEAVKLVSIGKDSKVRKSVDRILSIWEERNVYSEELINQLKDGLVQREEPPVSAPVNQKAALRSKIVAEFVPSAFIEHLNKYRSSMDEVELREKQLAAMRVDVCSTVALKKLKDKAGGKRFSKDFEDGSAKLQDFVAFLDREVKKGPALIEALENADIFYEMQYKEVKIVTNAYQTFANRVLHLKKKLDAIKSSLPDPDDSPIPSPSEDAPSPTGSESPFHGLTQTNSPDPELDGQALDDDMIALCDVPSPLSSPGDKDNRDVEDMDLSDVEELVEPAIIVEERKDQPDPASVSSQTLAPNVTEPPQASQAAPENGTTTPAPVTTPTTGSLPINLAGVDLGKISSIISTLTNAMKNTGTGVNPASRPSTSTSNTLPSTSSTMKSPPVSSSPAAPASNSLAKILSRVDINPGTLLNVLSKTQAQGIGFQGLSSFLSSQNSTPSGLSLDTAPNPTYKSHASPNTNPLPPAPKVVQASTPQTTVSLQSSQSPSTMQSKDPQKDAAEQKDKPVNSTLDSKIDGFLQGNPGLRGFNMNFPPVLPWGAKAVDSPLASTENLGGTPVRDESGATPTQDEVMDEPAAQPLSYQGRPAQTTSAPAAPVPRAGGGLPMSAYTNNSWQEQNRHALQYGPGSQQAGNHYQRDFTLKQDFPSSGVTGRSQLVESLLPSSMADSNLKTTKNNEILTTPFSVGGADGASSANDGWYRDPRGHDQNQHAGANSEPYKENQHQSEERRHDTNQTNFFNNPLPPPPPIPQLPPPPQDFLPSVVSGVKDPTELGKMGDNVQASGNVPPYRSTNPVSHDDYDERLPNRIPAKETFHPHLNAPGPRHCGTVAPRPVRPGPQNGPGDFNHRPRVPVHNQHHPGMPRPTPPGHVRGYHEAPSSEDAYLDPHSDAPPNSSSSSPPPYNVEHPVSSHTRTFFPEERALPLHHPEPRLRPRLEHRTPHPPHHYRPPRPGPFPPQGPLRHPPPPHVSHHGEPPFQRGKRLAAPFGGPSRPAGPFFPPKRPFLPPRY